MFSFYAILWELLAVYSPIKEKKSIRARCPILYMILWTLLIFNLVIEFNPPELLIGEGG